MNRQGRKIPASSYYQSFITILDECDSLHFSHNLWSKLLSATANLAKFESFESWPFVRRCCRALLDQSGNQYRMTAKLVKIGLEAAELTQDPVLAADIICNMESNENRAQVSSIPPSTYMKLIFMCVKSGQNEAAERILKHCMMTEVPSNTKSMLYSLVLNGFAQCGDLENTEKLFAEMKESGLEQR